MHVIQTINDLLRGELSFIQLIHDTCPENSENPENAHLISDSKPSVTGVIGGVQIQNGDLAEADQQNRVEEEEDVEEEGAVGGFWDLQLETPVD